MTLKAQNMELKGFEPNMITVRSDENDFDYNCDIDMMIANLPDLDKLTAAQIAHLFSDLKSIKDGLDAEMKKLSKFFDLIKTVKLPAAFEREEVKTFTLEDGTRVTMMQNTFCQIVGDRDVAYQWLRDNGYPDAIKETVNSSTLKGIAGEILSGEAEGVFDMPDDLFKVSINPTTSVTKGKK